MKENRVKMQKQYDDFKAASEDRERELKLMEAGINQYPLWHDFLKLQRAKQEADTTKLKLMERLLDMIDKSDMPDEILGKALGMAEGDIK